MDRTKPQYGIRALGINASEPVRGKDQDSSRGYAMPNELQQSSAMPDKSPTSGRSAALGRVVDDARLAALKGPNPLEHIKNVWHRMAPFRPQGNFDGVSRRGHTIYKAPDIFQAD